MSQKLVIDYELVENHIKEMKTVADIFKACELKPTDDESTIVANDASKLEFEEIQKMIAQVGVAVNVDLGKTKELIKSFKNQDEKAGIMNSQIGDTIEN